MSEPEFERIIRLEEGLKTQGLLLEQRMNTQADLLQQHVTRSLEQWKRQEIAFGKLDENIVKLRRCYDARENQAKGAIWAGRATLGLIAIAAGFIGAKLKSVFGI